MRKKSIVFAIMIILSIFFNSCELFNEENTDEIPKDCEDSIVCIGLVEVNKDKTIYSSLLNGYNNVIGATYRDNSDNVNFPRSMLRLYQLQEDRPDDLIILGSFYLGLDQLYSRITDLSMNSRWVVVTLNHNIVTEGYVSLVSISDLQNINVNDLLVFNTTIDSAIANDTHLLVAYGSSLALYNIEDRTEPEYVENYPLSSPVSSMVAIDNGFFVITSNGYGILTTSDNHKIQFNEIADINISNCQSAYLVNEKLYLSGPSKFVGKTKILKVDISIPTSPIIEIIKDEIYGEFVDFSYDGNGSYFLIKKWEIQQYVENGNDLILKNSAPTPNTSYEYYTRNNRIFNSYFGVNVYKFE